MSYNWGYWPSAGKGAESDIPDFGNFIFWNFLTLGKGWWWNHGTAAPAAFVQIETCAAVRLHQVSKHIIFISFRGIAERIITKFTFCEAVLVRKVNASQRIWNACSLCKQHHLLKSKISSTRVKDIISSNKMSHATGPTHILCILRCYLTITVQRQSKGYGQESIWEIQFHPSPLKILQSFRHQRNFRIQIAKGSCSNVHSI